MRSNKSITKASATTRILLVALFGLVASCQASAPVQEMSDARQAIAVAKEAGAEEHAVEPLRAAEAYLDSAQRNLSERAFAQARRDALQAKDKALEALSAAERKRPLGPR